MSDEFHVHVVYKSEIAPAAISASELDLFESVLPDLLLLMQRFDDSEDD